MNEPVSPVEAHKLGLRDGLPRLSGQSSSFESQLIEQLPCLRSHARRLCKNQSLAEDLVQDTILKALRYKHSFELDTNLRAWLRQIMQSIFLSRLRRDKTEKNALLRLAFDPNGWPAPRQAPAFNELSPPVTAALCSLKEPFYRAIELVDIEQLSYREAAEQLNVPVGTVMSRLFRGRRVLARALSDDPPVAA